VANLYRHLKAGLPYCSVSVGMKRGYQHVTIQSARALLKKKGAKPWIEWAQKVYGEKPFSVTASCTGTRTRGGKRSREVIFQWDKWK
jgi:hypothetical protein